MEKDPRMRAPRHTAYPTDSAAREAKFGGYAQGHARPGDRLQRRLIGSPDRAVSSGGQVSPFEVASIDTKDDGCVPVVDSRVGGVDLDDHVAGFLPTYQTPPG